MGTDYIKHSFLKQDNGDAVVEATILFPIMTFIFAALVLIAMYLPEQAILQQSTQYAATAVATDLSDTWLVFDEGSMSYRWETDKNRLSNVYVNLLAAFSVGEKGVNIAEHTAAQNLSLNVGLPIFICYVDNKIVYKEVVVEGWQIYRVPVNLSIIGFPRFITVSASGTAVVHNGDEFIRSIDLATDFAQFLADKFGLSDIGDSISTFGSKVKSLLFG